MVSTEEDDRTYRDYELQTVDTVKQVEARPVKADGGSRAVMQSSGSGGALQLAGIVRPPANDLLQNLRLYQSIEQILGRRSQIYVQIVIPSKSAANVGISYRMALAGARLLGRRILLIDASGRHGENHGRKEASPNFLRLGEGVAEAEIVEKATLREVERGLFVVVLEQEAGGDDTETAAREIKALLQDTKGGFDMVVIVPPPVLENPLAMVVSGLVSGSVIAVESGTTRKREIDRVIHTLEAGGAPILGMVLCRHHGAAP